MKTARELIVLERSASVWIATVPGVPGCHSYGPSISRALTRMREALRLWGVAPRELEIVFRIPPELRGPLDAAADARMRADAAIDDAQRCLREAATALERARFSRRDTARLLGISHQRVQQLLDGG